MVQAGGLECEDVNLTIRGLASHLTLTDRDITGQNFRCSTFSSTYTTFPTPSSVIFPHLPHFQHPAVSIGNVLPLGSLHDVSVEMFYLLAKITIVQSRGAIGILERSEEEEDLGGGVITFAGTASVSVLADSDDWGRYAELIPDEDDDLDKP